MSTCPSSCTGSCPEIVPVTLNQTIIQIDGDEISRTSLYKVGSDFTDNGDGTSHLDLPSTPIDSMEREVILNGKPQGEDTSGAQANFSISGDILTLNFVPVSDDLIAIHYWALV